MSSCYTRARRGRRACAHLTEPARGQETVDAGASERADAVQGCGMRHDEPRIDPPDVKKNQCKPWLRKMWCVGKITVVYRDRMYDLLGLYAEEYDPKKPVICTDEKSKQLLENKKDPILMRSGRNERYDYEYKRNGTRNIFVAVEPKGGWRKASDETPEEAGLRPVHPRSA